MKSDTLSAVSSDIQVITNSRGTVKAIRVGAYCRVSTKMEQQKKSIETQMAAYERIICQHPGWMLAGIYADHGISGASVNRRTEFLRMIEDAEAGKLDYILVKSISRFSRNTVDLLNFVRALKAHGVYVYFEKEGIDTGDDNSEFLLSVFAAAAQEEVISLSNNLKVGARMRYAQGIQSWRHIYGYRKNWIIVPEEAERIRWIFDSYVNGKNVPQICVELNKHALSGSSEKWIEGTVSYILHNERYAGDLLMQKNYVTDPISGHMVKNRNAKIKQYFVRDHHEPIVSHKTFVTVQTILTMKNHLRGIKQYPFYNILKCPFCGENMVRFKFTNRPFWTCGGRGDGTIRCKRSKCIPFAVNEKALLAGLDALGLPLEYAPLRQLVSGITFSRWGFEQLCVTLREPEEKRILMHMEFGASYNTPYPIITDKEGNILSLQRNTTEKVMLISGRRIHLSTAERILKIREVVNKLIIEPPESYEANVPKVHSRKC